MSNISKEDFLAVYNENKPNKLTVFMYKYFSLSTKPNDLYLKKIVNSILIGLFVLLFIFVVLDIEGKFISFFNFSYAVLFFSNVGFRFYAHNQINKVALKISKKLNISIDEYILYYNRYM